MKNLNNSSVKEVSTKQMNNANRGLIGVLFLCTLVLLAPAAWWFRMPSRKAFVQPSLTWGLLNNSPVFIFNKYGARNRLYFKRS